MTFFGSETKIGPAAGLHIGQNALSALKYLTELDISCNQPSSQAVLAIAAAVSNTSSLKNLKLGVKSGKGVGEDADGYNDGARAQCWEQLKWMGPGLKMQ